MRWWSRRPGTRRPRACGAADLWRAMVVHQDAGLGLRVLLPQLSPQVFRFDFAIPFDEQMKRGLPLRFTAGINQAF